MPTISTAPLQAQQARLIGLLLIIGLGLRIWAYAANVSLWLDEILLSRNIIGLPLDALLTSPLHLDQVAPRGFLLVEKLAVSTLGGNELALRLFPFLAGVTGLVLFRRLAERALEGWAVVFAVAIYAIAIPFIRYGAEVKQYEVDAAASVLVMILGLDLWERELSTRRLVLVGLVGFTLTWVSQASVLVMAGIGLATALRWRAQRDQRSRRALSVVMPIWAAAALVAIAVGRRSMTPSTSAFMDDFWQRGFFPFPLRISTALGWTWDTALAAFTDPSLLRYRWPFLFLVVALLGLAALWRQRRNAALVLLCPLAIAALAAVAQQYPFRGRLMVYLIPGILVALAAGAEWIRRMLARLSPALGTAVMIGLLAPPVAALVEAPPPYGLEHHRIMLAYLEKHRRAGDAIHVFPLSRIGVLFYGPRYGLRPGEWTTAVCERSDTRAYLRDVDRYRGAPRLWLLTFGARPFRPARAAVRGYLDTIGVRRDLLSIPSLQFGTVTLELYDLSDSTRLRRAGAESYPVQPMPNDPAPGCRPWIKPSPADSIP